jgi:hypothetical protein
MRAPGGLKEGGPPLSLVTALPLSVWHEHLAPLLYVREAAGLRVVCKALKGLVMGWPMHLVWVRGADLEAALTCFPAIKSFGIELDEPLDPAEESRLVELLRGHGETLKRVKAYNESGERLLLSAVRAGALPSLTTLNLSLDDPDSHEVLSGGMLGLIEEMRVTISDGEQAAALEALQRLPRLRRVELMCVYIALEPAFPPFIPPSLKALYLDFAPAATLEALLRDLTPMLQASGASLEEFRFYADDDTGLGAEGVASLAQVIEACSPTLKTLKLSDDKGLRGTAGALVPGLMRAAATRSRSWSAPGPSSAPSPPPAPPSRA